MPFGPGNLNDQIFIITWCQTGEFIVCFFQCGTLMYCMQLVLLTPIITYTVPMQNKACLWACSCPCTCARICEIACPCVLAFLGLGVCVCVCVRFACVRTNLSSTQSPNQASPTLRRHANRWRSNESWGDTLIPFTTVHAVTWRLTSLRLGLNIGLSQLPHAHTWCCCFVTYTVLQMTFVARRNAF